MLRRVGTGRPCPQIRGVEESGVCVFKSTPGRSACLAYNARHFGVSAAARGCTSDSAIRPVCVQDRAHYKPRRSVARPLPAGLSGLKSEQVLPRTRPFEAAHSLRDCAVHQISALRTTAETIYGSARARKEGGLLYLWKPLRGPDREGAADAVS